MIRYIVASALLLASSASFAACPTIDLCPDVGEGNTYSFKINEAGGKLYHAENKCAVSEVERDLEARTIKFVCQNGVSDFQLALPPSPPIPNEPGMRDWQVTLEYCKPGPHTSCDLQFSKTWKGCYFVLNFSDGSSSPNVLGNAECDPTPIFKDGME